MANLRLSAVEKALTRTVKELGNVPSDKISDYFGVNSFGLDKMKEALSEASFKKVKACIDQGAKLDEETADAVAAVLKAWAIEKGATHCTHWFQPLTGSSAEKHDSFFNSLKGVEEFSGETLVQQEPDASSFPNGGIRCTNQARGYTGWDPSSPCFIVEETLCIPTIFVSYTGDTLDYKAPLLKAKEAIDKAATAVAQYFDESVESVSASLGCEQEYFLIDKAFYAARPDLYLTGRTIFGAGPSKGQQLDDHYFGTIAPRVYSFMKDFEVECLKLGIPVQTRHNEVAPGQFEVAPLFEEINVAVDHNLLLMDVMEKVGDRHDLKVLMHEKPFAGLNGSGKHNNWSLIAHGSGIRNLFKPEGSLYFLTFLVTTLKAVHQYGDMVRASIASAGNDHRLGANEAPPAIISAFLGETLSEFLDKVEATGELSYDEGEENYMELGINKIPELKLDNTDRNRTSPFAFTGNKFELRAVGSTQNSGTPMTVLNLIAAEVLTQFKETVDAKIAAGTAKEAAIHEVLVGYIKESKAVRFEGDGYSQEWVDEAASRGLTNEKDTPRALKFLISDEAKEIFAKHGVFNNKEIEARYEVWMEIYATKIDIEARTMESMALTKVLPAASRYLNQLVETASGAKTLGVDTKGLVATINEISTLIDTVKEGVSAMSADLDKFADLTDVEEHALAYCDTIKHVHMETIRGAVDALEALVDDNEWPLPKYTEMLFVK